MASWALTCKNCRAVFTYSQISETLADYFMPMRPEFPKEGLEHECPYCETKSTYKRHELVYRSERKSGGRSA